MVNYDLSKNFSQREQIDALNYSEGPLLINAGPGAGKTRILTFKVIDLILNKKVDPSEIIVCTFTEKAASEINERIEKEIYNLTGEKRNVDGLRIGTIHSVLLQFIDEYLEYTPLEPGYNILDELGQYLFIYHNLDVLDLPKVKVPLNSGGEKTIYEFDDVDVIYTYFDKWQMTTYLKEFIDRVVDEGYEIIKGSNTQIQTKVQLNDTLKILFNSYKKYKKLLSEHNYIDFSQIQCIYWEMLLNDKTRNKIRSSVKYMLVDEYQDTNFIQEKILLETLPSTGKYSNKLTNFDSGEKYPQINICVVGDFNQSLYGFRGANIDNILTFNKKFKERIKIIKIFQNYRSSQSIINVYNDFISENLDFYKKHLKLEPNEFKVKSALKKHNTPVFYIESRNRNISDYVCQMEQMISTLLKRGKIHTLSDVSILLPTVKYTEAKSFLEIFGPDKIKFQNELDFFLDPLIKRIIKTLLYIDEIKEVEYNDNFKQFYYYINDILNDEYKLSEEVISILSNIKLNDVDLLNVFYSIIDSKEYYNLTEDKLLKLGQLSGLIIKYTNTYKTNDVELFINDFLPFIFSKQENYFESSTTINADTEKIILSTIHQAKGLEFPVVITTLDKYIRNSDERYANIKNLILGLLGRTSVESEMEEELQLNRLYYVAFSRAKEILFINTRSRSNSRARRIINNVQKNPSNILYDIPPDFNYIPLEKKMQKPVLSFTRDIQTYNLCPYMYYLKNVMKFETPEYGSFIFGKMVHQTIEALNKYIVERSIEKRTLTKLKEIASNILNIQYENAVKRRESEDLDKDNIIRQVYNYIQFYEKYLDKMHIISVEEPFILEEDEFILKGRMDLILKTSEGYEIVDVKSGSRASKSKDDITEFENQVIMYGKYFFEKYGNEAKLTIFSTGEWNYQDGEYIVNKEKISETIIETYRTIDKILNKDYTITRKNCDLKKVCKNCSYKLFCKKRVI